MAPMAAYLASLPLEGNAVNPFAFSGVELSMTYKAFLAQNSLAQRH